ncbi:MAG: hypothetical protein V1874_04790 [Spirochaetota bacterium]
MQVSVNKDELYSMIKQAVKDVIREERIDFILQNVPFVSDEEMEDVKKLYGKKPPKKIDIARREIIDL